MLFLFALLTAVFALPEPLAKVIDIANIDTAITTFNNLQTFKENALNFKCKGLRQTISCDKVNPISFTKATTYCDAHYYLNVAQDMKNFVAGLQTYRDDPQKLKAMNLQTKYKNFLDFQNRCLILTQTGIQSTLSTTSYNADSKMIIQKLLNVGKSIGCVNSTLVVSNPTPKITQSAIRAFTC